MPPDRRPGPPAGDPGPSGRARAAGLPLRPLPLLVLLPLALTVACAGGPFRSRGAFERHFEAGRYRQAIDAFEADSALRRREAPLFRAGLLYADPREPYHDRERARELLGRLLELHPETEHRTEARTLLALLDRLAEAGARAGRLQAKLERLKKVQLGQPPDTGGVRRP